jgi:hypothetical protein
MSDSCSTFQAGSGREFGDAVLSLMAAVPDGWALGTSVMQTLVQQTGEAATDRPGQEPVAEIDPEAMTSDCGDIPQGRSFVRADPNMADLCDEYAAVLAGSYGGLSKISAYADPVGSPAPNCSAIVTQERRRGFS